MHDSPTPVAYYQNVRGLNTKLPEIYNALASCHYDIIAFSETFLNDSVHNSEISNIITQSIGVTENIQMFIVNVVVVSFLRLNQILPRINMIFVICFHFDSLIELLTNATSSFAMS